MDKEKRFWGTGKWAVPCGILALLVMAGLCLGLGVTVYAQSSLPKNTQLKLDAEKGDPKTMVELAFQYQTSDKDEMIKWLRKAAQKDYPPAQYELGKVLMAPYFSKTTGKSVLVREDPTAAAKLYSRAASLGYSPAQIALAQCYEYGKGMPENKSYALRWYLVALKDKESSSSQVWGKAAVDRLSLELSATQIQSAQLWADTFKPMSPPQ
jgi:TPR repeat protein